MDVAARRNRAIRIVAKRKAEAKRATSARCGTARGKLRPLCARQRHATPLATGERDVGPRGAAGQRNAFLPAEHRGNGLRVGHASPALLDIAVRHKSAGHIVENRTTGAWHARSVRCGTARGNFERRARGNAPRRRWRRRQRRGATAGGRAAKRLPAENRENGLRIGNGAGIVGHRGAAQEYGPHRRNPQDRSEGRAKRAIWYGARPA